MFKKWKRSVNGEESRPSSTCPIKQAPMRSELASRFSTSTGAATAAEASKAPRATAFRENFMVEGGGEEGGGVEGR